MSTIDSQEPKPLLTFALITYNQEHLVAEAVKGALSQTYSPLEIILSDDCSPDKTFEIMQSMASSYQGPNKVIVRKTEKNLGMLGHINDLMKTVKGELVIIAAGDDISLPERAERICEEYLASSKKACSIFSNATWIDENGNKMNPLYKKPFHPSSFQFKNYATNKQLGFVNGSTQAWKKDVFDFFGDIPEEAGAEDTTIPFRSVLLGEIRYIDEFLVLYRRDTNRFRNDDGQSNFKKYRQKWIGWTKQHRQMYAGRLKDLDDFLSRKDHAKTNEEIEFVRQFTQKRIAELEAIIGIVNGQPLDEIALFQKKSPVFANFLYFKTWLFTILTPAFGLIRLEIYFKYQDLRSQLGLI